MNARSSLLARFAIFIFLFLAQSAASGAPAQTQPQSPSTSPQKPPATWNSVEFAILRYNENAPNSWNIYHSGKKGVFLVRLWKRYLLVRVDDEEVYDIDPQTIKVAGNSVSWSSSDMPEKPIETPDWKERDIGLMKRIRFRLGKDGHFLELQIPLGPNGRSIY
jgi:hypothetical protein